MRFPVQIVTILSFALLLNSCSSGESIFQRKQQVYQAPKLGAEYRFEEGLRKEKKPQDLFSKKERKEMEKMGMSAKQDRSAPNTRITSMQADSILTGKTRDTTKTAGTDSTRAIPADTTLPQSTDTASHFAPADVPR